MWMIINITLHNRSTYCWKSCTVSKWVREWVCEWVKENMYQWTDHGQSIKWQNVWITECMMRVKIKKHTTSYIPTIISSSFFSSFLLSVSPSLSLAVFPLLVFPLLTAACVNPFFSPFIATIEFVGSTTTELSSPTGVMRPVRCQQG